MRKGKKWLVVLMVFGLAGIASADLVVGNPNAGNGWSTTSAVSVKASHSQWDRNSIHLIDGTGMDAATGTMHNAGDNNPRELWNSQYSGSSGVRPSRIPIQMVRFSVPVGSCLNLIRPTH